MSEEKKRESMLKKIRGLFSMLQSDSGAFKGKIANASRLMQKLMARVATGEYITEREADPDIQEFMRIAGVKQFRHMYGLGHEHPNVWRAYWCCGVASGIHTVLREEQRERSQETSTALIVLSTKLAKTYKDYSQDFRCVNTGCGSVNSAAYSAGSDIGKTLNLKSAVAKKIKGG